MWKLFHFELQEKLEPRSYLSWTADWGGEHNNPHTQNTFIIFISAIASNFFNWRYFCFIFNYRNSFNCKFKKLINEQVIVFYSPLKGLCLFDEIVQIKHFNHHAFIGMCSLSRLNIRTGHQTMSDKKSSFVRRGLLDNGHGCPA